MCAAQSLVLVQRYRSRQKPFATSVQAARPLDNLNPGLHRAETQGDPLPQSGHGIPHAAGQRDVEHAESRAATPSPPADDAARTHTRLSRHRPVLRVLAARAVENRRGRSPGVAGAGGAPLSGAIRVDRAARRAVVGSASRSCQRHLGRGFGQCTAHRRGAGGALGRRPPQRTLRGVCRAGRHGPADRHRDARHDPRARDRHRHSVRPEGAWRHRVHRIEQYAAHRRTGARPQ